MSEKLLNDGAVLGKRVTKFEKFDTFDRPKFLTKVVLTSDEVTALCPITEQPDFYVVKVSYLPNEKCLESKSVKLYFQSLRNTGMFVEALSTKVLEDIQQTINANNIKVDIVQKARGGVEIVATSETVGGEESA